MNSAVSYTASKGYKHWAGDIENLKEVDEKVWKTDHPDKKQYTLKFTTKIKYEGGDSILKQRWSITDCELQAELKNNYNNKLCQKLSEKAVYCKNGKGLYNFILGQLHSNIIAVA